MCGALSDERSRPVVFSCCWVSPAQSFSGLSPAGLVNTCYCLRSWGCYPAKVKVTLRLTVGRSVCQSANQSACPSPSQNYITTGGQSASLSWCQAPIWDPRPIFLLLSLFIFRRSRICLCGVTSRVSSFQQSMCQVKVKAKVTCFVSCILGTDITVLSF
jgi:hypothetical protein